MNSWDIVFLVAFITIAAIAVVGNILVMLAVFSHRRLRNPANYLMANLAVSDFFQGAISMPIRVAEVLNTNDQKSLIRCDVVISISILFHSASNFNLALIALDRFIAVSKPFAYANVVKTSSYKIVIVISWLLSVIISAGPVIGWRRFSSPGDAGHVCRYGTTLTDEYIIMYFILVDFTTLIIMLITYTYIFRTTRRQINQIRAQEIAVNHAAINQAFDCRRTSQTNWEQAAQSVTETPGENDHRVKPFHSEDESSEKASTADNNNDDKEQAPHKSNQTSNGRSRVTPQTSSSMGVLLSTTRSRKATRTVMAIIGCFVVLCMPITFIDVFEIWCEQCATIPPAVITVALCMLYFNCCVNVFVYGGYNTDYRKAYWHIWQRARDTFLNFFTRTKTTPQVASAMS